MAAPLVWPAAIQPTDMELRKVTVTPATRAITSGAQQVQDMTGAWWECALQLPRRNVRWMAAFDGWSAGLNGASGTFVMPVFDRKAPFGDARLTGSSTACEARRNGQTLTSAFPLPSDATSAVTMCRRLLSPSWSSM